MPITSLRKTMTSARGFTTVGALILISLLSVIGAAVLASMNLELETSARYRSSLQAFYVAEAGLHRSIHEIKSLTVDTSNAYQGDNSLGNGYYVVEVTHDQPEPGQVLIRSTGYTSGVFDSEASLEVVGKQAKTPEAFKYGLVNCDQIHFQGNSGNTVEGDVFVGGNFNIHNNSNTVLTGEVQSTGDMTLANGQVIGVARSNGDITLGSPSVPDVEGDAIAGNKVKGNGTVSGIVDENVHPDPVTDICDSNVLKDMAVTLSQIQEFRDNADLTITGNHALENENLSGIIHVTGDLNINESITLQKDSILIVDGDVTITGPGHLKSAPAGAMVTILVPNGNLSLHGNGVLRVDGLLQMGSISDSGVITASNKGDIHINASDFRLNGSAVMISGQMHTQTNSKFTITHQTPTSGEFSNSFLVYGWKDSR